MRKINLLVLTAMLLAGIVFSIIQVIQANPDTPNPGHSVSAIECGTSFCVSTTTGNVGIGSINPSYKLDVSGDVRWTGTLQGGSVPWQRLTTFPDACPTGQSVTAISAGSLTCTTTAVVGNFVPITGGTMTGELILNSLLSHNDAGTFFINSNDGLQLRINADGGTGIFNVNNSANTTVFSVSNSGTTIVGSGGTGKLTVGTVDPVFDIRGDKYATYLSGMTGVKEETTGVVSLTGGKYVIDFNNLEQGSDPWVFYQVTDFGENWDKLAVLLSADGPGEVWYEKEVADRRLVIYGDTASAVSYRLTAPRFDWQKWLNLAEDGSVEGLVVGGNINDQYAETAISNISSPGTAGLFEEFIQKLSRALIVKVKEMVASIVRTDNIEIKGKIQLQDQANGEVYCTWIEQGEWVKVKGTCESK